MSGELQVGQLILNGKYRLEAEIGRGAFCVVYRAVNIPLNSVRAIKVLRKDAPGVGASEFIEYRVRFWVEAQVGARVSHPHVLRVYDAEQDDDMLALVMEYASGGSLAGMLAEPKGLTIAEGVRIAREVAEGLAALHVLDMVHRDIKPSNILMGADGRAMIADLGLVQVPDENSRSSRIPESQPGTPLYMSPEQVAGASYVTPASDVYALGCVLFEMLTGRVFRTQRPTATVRSFRADVPSFLDDALHRMLAERPQDRPWDGGEAGKLLSSVQKKYKVAPTTVRRPRETIEVFFAYSRKDEALRDELEMHLSPLKRSGAISGWHDRRIEPGEEWERKIDAHLNGATVILLLVSASFVSSDYCWDVEMKRAMERHERGEAQVIPVILRKCSLRNVPFGKLQFLPTDGKAVTSWSNMDEALADVAEGIERAVEAWLVRREGDVPIRERR